VGICNALALMTQLLYSEGRGEDLEGQLAILQVIQNRTTETEDICDVIRSPGQFVYSKVSDSKELETTVDLFLQGELKAPPWSMDKTHFYSGEKPYWAVVDKCYKHGNHTFCRVD